MQRTRRVVVTGLGMLSPLGSGVDINWRRLLAGESGIRVISRFDVSDIPSRIAGLIPRISDDFAGDMAEGVFDPDQVMPPKDQRKVDDFIIYGIAAAQEAIADSGWHPDADDIEALERTGVMIGSGIGGLSMIERTAEFMAEKGTRRVSPFFIPASLINLCSGQVSIAYGFRGPNHAPVTACATGTHAIGDAARMIMLDDADVMVAGGTEGAVCRLGLAGFAAAKTLSTSYNDTPHLASRPYDQGRDGFVMGEGAGVVVLEEYEHAKARGAKIYAEIVGYGLSGDAHHVTSPPPDGNGGRRAMEGAFRSSGLTPADIDYINAHGTSTPVGDDIEIAALKGLFGDAIKNVSVSSTKSAIGHLLGAAGAVEAIYSLLAIRDQIAPPTLNLEKPSEAAAGVDLVPKQPRQRKIATVMSNSFGFGGTNASVIFRTV